MVTEAPSMMDMTMDLLGKAGKNGMTVLDIATTLSRQNQKIITKKQIGGVFHRLRRDYPVDIKNLGGGKFALYPKKMPSIMDEVMHFLDVAGERGRTISDMADILSRQRKKIVTKKQIRNAIDRLRESSKLSGNKELIESNGGEVFALRKKKTSRKSAHKNTLKTVPIRVAINGFGRIGRMVVRAIVESGRKDIEVVAINDLAQPQQAAHLLRYDSAHGAFSHPVSLSGDVLSVGTACKKAKLFSERDPSKLPWGKLKVDVVLECTGRFTARDKAAAHLDAGAKRVLVSAPATNADLTVVYGVNHKLLRKDHRIVSNASCTTNCLAPVAQLMHQLCGIEHGHMTTIHAYTGDQALVDMPHSDPRRARAAAASMIPTTTGAARAVSLVLPELKGRLDGAAVRVPVLNVSVVDLTFRSAKDTDVASVNRAMKRAASSKKWQGILGVVEEPLVSVDFNHNSHSSIFDTTQTQMLGKRLVRVVSWYDNEWGFANRMGDVAVCLGALG